MWKKWKNKLLSLGSRRNLGDVNKNRHQRRLCVEVLEERQLLSTNPYEWIGDHDDN
jgi:hypothetical protein